jgi:hypothetical protein
LERHTASIFKVKVSQLGKIVGYTEEGRKEIAEGQSEPRMEGLDPDKLMGNCRPEKSGYSSSKKNFHLFW